VAEVEVCSWFLRRSWFLLLIFYGCTQQALPARAHVVPAAFAPKRPVEIVNGPAAANVNSGSAVIWWDTNVKSSSVVHYGTSPTGLNQTVQDSHHHAHHSLKLLNLTPHTTYYFQVESVREGMGAGTSELGVFTTPP
jgi:hypothetical protein